MDEDRLLSFSSGWRKVRAPDCRSVEKNADESDCIPSEGAWVHHFTTGVPHKPQSSGLRPIRGIGIQCHVESHYYLDNHKVVIHLVALTRLRKGEKHGSVLLLRLLKMFSEMFSECSLSTTEQAVLGKGLNFAPAPSRILAARIVAAVESGLRRVPEGLAETAKVDDAITKERAPTVNLLPQECQAINTSTPNDTLMCHNI